MNRDLLITQVQAYAEAHYTEGWDVVVECYDRDMIADQIGRARTLHGALAKFATLVSVHADRTADARNSAF